MPYVFANNATSSLASGITNSQTTLSVKAGEGDLFPAVSSPDYFMVTLVKASGDREIVKCTARTAGSDTMTVVRAQEGTSGTAFSADDVVEHRLTAGALDHLMTRLSFSATAKTSDYSVTADDLDGSTWFTNTGAGAEVNFSLPAGADGYIFQGYVDAAQYFRVTADGTETIRWNTMASAAGGYIRSNVVGRVVVLRWLGGEWVVTDIIGAWNQDA